MKPLQYIILIPVLILSFTSCKEEINNLNVLDDITAPSNLSVSFDITQDNTGLVTVYPVAEGVTEYLITFGDITDEQAASYAVNEKITHIYGEGVFTVGIDAVGITGLKTHIEQSINVTFRQPENLIVTVEYDEANPKKIYVTADADYASVIDIYFGDQTNEVPVHILPGETTTHTYAEAGDYELRVVAKSGGAATTEYTETITISAASDPVNLPIDFESFMVNYAFTDFGGVISSVIDNPDVSGINTSDRVAKSIKPSGAETWAGTYLTLESPINFTSKKMFKVKVHGPKSGIVVKLKVENISDGTIFHEVDVVTTHVNTWEELSFDFSGIDDTKEYQKVILFFDFGNTGDDSEYLFDDIRLVLGEVPTVWPIEDFEGTPPTFTTFGNIAAIEIVANPNQTGLNTTANVAKFTKTSGSETWAGCFFEVIEPLDFENYTKVKMKSLSPVTGSVVKMKLENADASVTYEVDLTTTVADQWEEFVYDFSSAPAADYTKIVVFYDFGDIGDGTIYYFDEIELTN
jgi:hypothetical protein